jgi:hypothetical protein
MCALTLTMNLAFETHLSVSVLFSKKLNTGKYKLAVTLLIGFHPYIGFDSEYCIKLYFICVNGGLLVFCISCETRLLCSGLAKMWSIVYFTKLNDSKQTTRKWVCQKTQLSHHMHMCGFEVSSALYKHI